MNYIFIPLIFLPVFVYNNPEPLAYVQYAPAHIYGPKQQEYVYITEDYHPYTHGYYPDDGSEFWEEES